MKETIYNVMYYKRYNSKREYFNSFRKELDARITAKELVKHKLVFHAEYEKEEIEIDI